MRFTDKTELCWVMQTAHVIREADLSDWKRETANNWRCTPRTKSVGRSEQETALVRRPEMLCIPSGPTYRSGSLVLSLVSADTAR